jgi:predicted lipoprotein with Yx(FWY)xxD motif
MGRSIAGLAALAAAGLLAATGVARAEAPQLPAGITTRSTADGLALADSQGRQLYHLDQDRTARRFKGAGFRAWGRCTEACHALWSPVAAPADFKPAGDWGVWEGWGGVRQLTFRNDPLYVYLGKSFDEAAALDIAPPFLSGYAGKPIRLEDGVPRTTLYWHAATIEPPAPKTPAPAGVTPHWEKTAFVFADARDRKLYTPKAGGGCAADCGGLKPLLAPLAALPVGEWRPVTDRNGERVWAYRGQMVYQAADADSAPGPDWRLLELR